ncbi:MAG TPA: hypothetical protein VGB06_02365 [Solirubrobacterales bacterium]|jgi:hypothetical protein
MADGPRSPGKFKVVVDGAGLTIDTEVDQTMALQVVNLLMSGEPTSSTVPEEEDKGAGGSDGGSEGGAKKRRRKLGKGSKVKGKKQGSKVRRQSLGLAKDLSLRPKNKKPFADFVQEKHPVTQHDKNAVCVYWLTIEAGHKATPEAVNTCYQGAEWKRPADLRNALRLTASKKGWIDTADSEDITITTSGEDHVRHDLPKTAKK